MSGQANHMPSDQAHAKRTGQSSGVSVIMPAYNAEAYIEKAIRSILDQTVPPMEVVVVDDGSTDSTAERVAEFGDAVRYLSQANAGPTVARNHGVRSTTGPLLAFLDSDDWWDERKLELQLAALSENPDLGFAVSHIQNVWMEDLADEAERYEGRMRGEPVPGYVTQSLLLRRSIYEELGGFDESLPHTEIMDFFMRAEEAGVRGVCLVETLVFRRMHAESLSRRDRTQHLDEVFALLKKRVSRDRKPNPDASSG